MKKSVLYVALCCAFLGGGGIMSLPARAEIYDFSKANWKGCGSDSNDSDNSEICNKMKKMGLRDPEKWIQKSSKNSKNSKK